MAANRARFEAIEGAIQELRDAMVTLTNSTNEIRTMIGGPKHEKREIEENPFFKLGSDHEEEDWVDDEPESEGSREDRRWRNPIRMEFSKFSGNGDPRVWIDQAHQFFQAQETPARKWVQWASYHLDGEANQWWRWYCSRHRKITWSMFVKGFMRRFSTTEAEEADEAIVRLKQTGDFRSYLAEFERLVNCVPNWGDKALLGVFMVGVREEIAREVRFFRPQSLEQAIEIAKHCDEQQRLRRGAGSVRNPPRSNMVAPTTSRPSNQAATTSAPPSRRLSWAEQQARREKRLCFNCDEQFVRGHNCKKPQVLLMEACEEREEPPPIYDEDEEEGNPTISLNALMGETGGKSMRMKGQIGRDSVQILVDSGVSLNFINPR